MKNVLTILLLIIPAALIAQDNFNYSHLTYSQVGYDTHLPKNAMVQDTSFIFLDSSAFFSLRRIADDQEILKGKIVPAGKKWGKYWWRVDFSSCHIPGNYYLKIHKSNEFLFQSDNDLPIKIGNNILWDESWYYTAIGQLNVRDSLSYKPEGGWKDCGSVLQEVSSHVIMLNALCDIIEMAGHRLTDLEKKEVIHHLIVGSDYIAVCQDKAKDLGLGDGPVVHEVRENHKIITGNAAKTAMILARVSRLVEYTNPEKSSDYKVRSIKAYKWIQQNGPIVYWDDSDNFAITHGAPEGMRKPPGEWMTRDLVMMKWAALELYKCGEVDYKSQALKYARKIISRQVPEDKAEEGLYGHFYTYDSYLFTEKANIHCGAWDLPYKNYNQGGHLPHYLIPLIEMTRIWPDHSEKYSWEQAIHNFAYHYFLPATKRNPFNILPAGYYQGIGLLNFSGWYHGHNKIFGYAAALSLEFYVLYRDPQFLETAVGNLQWIAGLHSGFQGSNEYTSASMIVGIGNIWKSDWDSLKGTITNGFESDGQFKLTKPSLETDLPAIFGDEGGIHHCAGWISGLCRLIKIFPEESRIDYPDTYMLPDPGLSHSMNTIPTEFNNTSFFINIPDIKYDKCESDKNKIKLPKSHNQIIGESNLDTPTLILQDLLPGKILRKVNTNSKN